MKKIQILTYALIVIIAISSSCTNGGKKHVISKMEGGPVQVIGTDSLDATNDFYDNAECYDLNLHPVYVGGEIVESGNVDFSKLPLRSVIVKEALLTDSGNKFTGAYRYDGYSLFDILNNKTVDKANAKEFEPIIDLYVEIENEAGDKAMVSWGEIYYPNHLHDILIAKRVTRIVPSKTKDLWSLPTESKLVVAADLLTERNISAPVKITVKSYPTVI